ncbi:hypothetical protein [Methanocaldococcus fervens]|uniref:Uncharacterized protein n=1 Tax=Methanocaldococcus fervens (strain DSM 4213 / JCM 15782 / AG86) TaxID=573064 RepID=C7P9R6_METFA|nr:hypothetical protein [Methanocaldococcus fervens]ACV25423.1 hypothetical protein Mefer_1620 [Methanocaldococcus fervens AG86]
MGLFGKFKTNYNTTQNQSLLQERTEPENLSTETKSESNPHDKKRLSNPIKLLRKKQIEKEKESIALNALAPYKAHQKAIIWNSGRGEKIFGYPIAIIPQPNGMYVILYRKRYYDWLDELITTLKSIITGKKEQYRAVHVPESCIDISEELITIYAHSFFIVNSYTEIAIPLGENPKDRMAYLLSLQEAEMYRNALEKMGYEFPNVIDSALNLNPTMRAYIGKETMSDKKKKTSKTKEFAGFDMSFSFDRFLKSLGGYDDERE